MRHKKPDTLDNSLVVRCLINLCVRIANRLKSDLIKTLIVNVKEQFFNSPLKTIGMIVISLTTVNITLIMVLGRQMTLGGLFARGLLVIVGISGLWCNADATSIKKGSKIISMLHSRAYQR